MEPMNLQIDEIIKNALIEDMPYGDISTDALFDGSEKAKAQIMAKEEGVAAGLFVAARVFEIIDDKTVFVSLVSEGAKVKKGEIMAEISGTTASLLKAERLALNFLQRMCGIAAKTKRMVELAKGSGIKITDTRKTTPNLRVLEKYAVRAGGGTNHRFSLSDAVMLKENHIKAAGSIKKAVEKARKAIPHTMKIEVETTCLSQVREAMDAGSDIIMLDNMKKAEIVEAVKMVDRKVILEVSGNITEKNINEKLIHGIDIMSSGSLTHSVKAMDISMLFV